VKPVRTVSGTVAALDRQDVDTDQIIPKQFLRRIERTGYGEFLFPDWRKDPDFELNQPAFAGAPILAAGRNFGCGSSREHAAWALADAGFGAVVAPSFSDIFETNAGKNGLLAVTLPEEAVEELLTAAPAPARVDLRTCTITLPSGGTVPFEIDRGLRERPLNGWDDISLTENRLAEIEAYERDRERDGPSTLALDR